MEQEMEEVLRLIRRLKFSSEVEHGPWKLLHTRSLEARMFLIILMSFDHFFFFKHEYTMELNNFLSCIWRIQFYCCLWWPIYLPFGMGGIWINTFIRGKNVVDHSDVFWPLFFSSLTLYTTGLNNLLWNILPKKMVKFQVVWLTT